MKSFILFTGFCNITCERFLQFIKCTFLNVQKKSNIQAFECWENITKASLIIVNIHFVDSRDAIPCTRK